MLRLALAALGLLLLVAVAPAQGATCPGADPCPYVSTTSIPGAAGLGTGVQNGELNGPTGLVLGPGGTNLYIVEATNNRITQVNAATGAFVQTWGAAQLSGPRKATTDGTYLFVTDTGNDRVMRY